jgi:hypothetical protein
LLVEIRTSINSDVSVPHALSSDLPQRAKDAAHPPLEAHDAADDVVACRRAPRERAAGDDATGAGAREEKRQG